MFGSEICAMTGFGETERFVEQLQSKGFGGLSSSIKPRLNERWARRMCADRFIAATSSILMGEQEPITSPAR